MRERILNSKTVKMIKGFITFYATFLGVFLLLFISGLLESNNRTIGVSLIPIVALSIGVFIMYRQYYLIKKSIHQYKITEGKFIRFERSYRFIDVYVSYRNELNDEKIGKTTAFYFSTVEALQQVEFEIAYKEGSDDVLIVNYEELSYEDEKVTVDKKDEKDLEKGYDDFFDKEKYKL